MLEYLFFNREIADKFITFLKTKPLEWEEFVDPALNTIVIKLPEEIDDELWDELDDYHDQLSPEDQKLLEIAMEDTTVANTAGIYIQLAGDKQTIAQVDPDVMNRMLEVVSMDEFNAFIETIVSSVENPDDSPICHV